MVAALLEGYNDLPSYRGVMDTEGAGGPADVSLIGSEDEVRAGLAAFADAGATDFSALEFIVDPADAAPTRALLQEVAAPADPTSVDSRRHASARSADVGGSAHHAEDGGAHRLRLG